MAIESRGPEIITVGVLFLTLTWVLTILRCFVRIHMARLFRIDDWFALATLVVYSVFCSFVLIGEKYGTGRHLKDIPQEDFVMSMKWWYCGEITYVLSTCLVKVYIGIFLGQICIKRSQIIIIWTICIGFTTFSVYYLFVMMFQCRPISYFWTRYSSGTSGTCINPIVIVDSTYAHSVLSAIVDWTLGILPIFVVWNLKMNTRTKFSVAFILALGAVGSIATVIRIPYIHQLAMTQDFLYDNTDVSIWSTVEPGMGIAASSIACLRPLFRSIYVSYSTHISSVTAVNTPAGNRYASRRSHHRLSEPNLFDNLGRSIHVTTVINTHSAPDSRTDLEAGMVCQGQKRSEITITSDENDGWSKNLSADNAYEMGRITPGPGKSNVVCTAGEI